MTVLEIIAEHKKFTPEQRALAFCPMPRKEPRPAGDCRLGGSAGLDFNFETLRDRVIQARFRFLGEQKRMEGSAV